MAHVRRHDRDDEDEDDRMGSPDTSVANEEEEEVKNDEDFEYEEPPYDEYDDAVDDDGFDAATAADEDDVGQPTTGQAVNAGTGAMAVGGLHAPAPGVAAAVNVAPGVQTGQPPVGTGPLGGAAGLPGDDGMVIHKPVRIAESVRTTLQYCASDSLPVVLAAAARAIRTGNRHELFIVQAAAIILRTSLSDAKAEIVTRSRYTLGTAVVAKGQVNRRLFEEGLSMLHQTLNYIASGSGLRDSKKRQRADRAIMRNESLNFTVTSYIALDPNQIALAGRLISKMNFLSIVANKLVNGTPITPYTSVLPANSNFIGFMRTSKMSVFKYAVEGYETMMAARAMRIPVPGTLYMSIHRLKPHLAVMRRMTPEKLAYMGHMIVKPEWYKAIMENGPLCAVGVQKMMRSDDSFKETAGKHAYQNVKEELMTVVETFIQRVCDGEIVEDENLLA